MSTASLRKQLVVVAAATALLLLIPAVAMQFTSEVAWGPGDFIIAGAVLLGAGALAVLGLSRFKGWRARAALITGLAFGLATVWAELAVGLFR